MLSYKRLQKPDIVRLKSVEGDFLVQMIYYNFADSVAVLIPNMALRLGFGILNCVAAGVVFYLIENKLTGILIEKLQK